VETKLKEVETAFTAAHTALQITEAAFQHHAHHCGPMSHGVRSLPGRFLTSLGLISPFPSPAYCLSFAFQQQDVEMDFQTLLSDAFFDV
jgi:hypothetical protein